MVHDVLNESSPASGPQPGPTPNPVDVSPSHSATDLSSHRLPSPSPSEDAPKVTIDLRSLEYGTERDDSLRQHGSPPPDNSQEEDPYGGQLPHEFRFDRSLARTHLLLSTGLGLGIAQASLMSFKTVGRVGVDESLTVAGGFSGLMGFLAFAGALRYFISRTFGPEELKKESDFTTPGYGAGVADVLLPALLVAGIGIKLFETHAVGCLGGLAATSLASAGYHVARHRRFSR